MTRIIRFLIIFSVLAVGCILTSCGSSEIRDMQEQIKQHEAEIQHLKALVQTANDGVSALQKTVLQIKSGGYVTSVTPDEKNGTVIGYTLTFGSGEAIYLSTGSTSTPRISAKAFSGSDYFWTLDDEWLLDEDGNMVPVDSNGDTPTLSNDGGNWFITLGDGQPRLIMEAVTSSQTFKSIDTSNPNYVLITLPDGTVLQLTTWAAYVSLKNLVSQLNANISSVRRIVDALSENDYLLSVVPLIEDGVEKGWIMDFSKSGTMTVYSIQEPHSSNTPTMKYEDGYWWVADGDGGEYIQLSEAIEGDMIITGIDSSAGTFATVTFSDGSTLDIPIFQHSKLIMSIPEEGLSLGLGEGITFSFEVTGTLAEEALVTAFSDGNFVTSVTRSSPTGGFITVTCVREFEEGYIVALMNDPAGYSETHPVTILFRQDSDPGTPAEPDPGTAPDEPYNPVYPEGYFSSNYVTVPCEGGQAKVETVSYHGLSVMHGQQTWITMNTQQISYDHFDINFNLAENPSHDDRYASFYVAHIGTIIVRQEGNPAIEPNPHWGADWIVLPPEGGSATITVVSKAQNIQFSHDPWVKISFGESWDNYTQTVTFSADAWNGCNLRHASVPIDCVDAHGIIEIVQLPPSR